MYNDLTPPAKQVGFGFGHFHFSEHEKLQCPQQAKAHTKNTREEKNMKNKGIIFLKVSLALILAILSITVISGKMSSPATYKTTIASLDNKKETAIGLTAAVSATSIGIAAVPTDVTNPIANELADLTSYFLIIFGALILEKYLLTIIGYIAFKFLIPAACILFAINAFLKSEYYSRLIKKLIIIGFSSVLIIPVGEKVSGLLQDTYEASFNTLIEDSENIELIENAEEDDDEGFFSSLWNKISESATDAVENVKGILNKYIEATAIMIITTCVIPLLVLAFFVWFIKFIIGLNINLPSIHSLIMLKKRVDKVNPTKKISVKNKETESV